MNVNLVDENGNTINGDAVHVDVIEAEPKSSGEPIDITPEMPNMPENFAGFPNSQGDPKCYIYFDMEFTGLRRDADIISIALVDNIGRSFYAVFNDYDENKVNDWLKENVISHLNTPTENVMDGNDWKIVGNRTEISNALHEWIKVLAEGRVTVQFIADVGHYDFVLLIDLLLNDTNKTALDLPEYISPCLYDMNQDISTHVFINPKESVGLVPIRAAFDIARLDAIKDMELEPPEGEQHNALYDVKILKAMHNYLWDIK